MKSSRSFGAKGDDPALVLKQSTRANFGPTFWPLGDKTKGDNGKSKPPEPHLTREQVIKADSIIERLQLGKAKNARPGLAQERREAK